MGMKQSHKFGFRKIKASARGAAILTIMAALSGCVSAPSQSALTQSFAPQSAASKSGAILALPDTVYFHQQDPRWARQALGGTKDTLHSHGCLVSAVAMAMSNLGFYTDPGDLAARLTAAKGFTNRGWLIWNKLEAVTNGKAKTQFYDSHDDDTIRQCMQRGFYPLVKFDLPSGQSHWAVVIAETSDGFYVRDPMVSASSPIPLKARAPGIDAVRCIGVPKG